jgi:hypothetical protein
VRPLSDENWEAYLLDLDRARIRTDGTQDGKKNLARLERSLAKARAHGRITWQDADRAALLAGHEEGLRGNA